MLDNIYLEEDRRTQLRDLHKRLESENGNSKLFFRQK